MAKLSTTKRSEMIKSICSTCKDAAYRKQLTEELKKETDYKVWWHWQASIENGGMPMDPKMVRKLWNDFKKENISG